ncbi:DUF808 domain-containing protein [Arenimonas donghaensis]|uniref:DUF808 domain-containing protein n=1 Tax=Arenimonas donghaensis DSM 18148 = HO3-R19 TaxID=1121014 RepID=A0A087MLJ9_9GAMM|nr:DUF808 domain-containing protein [Arenimonas donghaensis]KFL37752.1 hypothetical protein N788_00860 [Arenimonas donghaensis DSM 18148 = HO3-R19]
MASSLLALLDDIATLLDDVSVMTKVATKKTAGVLGDDLALNAQQVSGVKPDRELPVVWAVAKGSARNKLILVPGALAIAALEAWLRERGIDVPIITSLMLIGGAFLCYEGVEKLAHKFLHSPEEQEAEVAQLLEAASDEKRDLVAYEKQKIKGAIRTDFILSAEIIVLTLGTVAGREFTVQLGVLVAIAALMTVGVYGLVAGIVKLDDAGLHLSRRQGAGSAARSLRAFGRGILYSAPWLMKFLSVAGTAAMFLVGGGIFTHSIPYLHHLVGGLLPSGGAGTVVSILADAVVGILVGIVVVLATTAWGKLRGKAAAH